MADELVVVIDSQDDITVSLEQVDQIEVVIAGEGGWSTATTTFDVVAAVAIGGHRIVAADSTGKGIYADKDVLSTLQHILGISVGAAAQGDSVTILPNGIMSEPSWTLNMGLPVFLGNTGQLTQVAPTSGSILQVGVAVAATRLYVDIKIPIVIGG